jgi:DNA-binding CsgD family transcriptional regulator
MYKLAPRYIKRSCNYQHLELVKIKDGKADFISYLEPDVVRIASGYSFQLTAGTLAAIRTSEGRSPANAEILFDQSPLKNIVKKMYRHHQFTYRQKGDKISISQKTIGRRICLEKEVIDTKIVFSKNYTFKPPHNALLLTENLVHNGFILLREGDIFDAPYSRICINWDTNMRNSAAKTDFKKNTDRAKQTLILLEEQVKLAEDHFFESEKLREKEKRVSKMLKMANQNLKKEIAKRKKAEMLLKAREKEMEIQTANMQAANTALRVLLKKRDEDKRKFSEKVLFNIKELILPYLEKLKETDLKAHQRAYVEILESNFDELSSPLALKLSLKYFDLTRAEIRVAVLVKQGKTTQQIAEILRLSPRTIDAYRANIRRKLKINNKKINLCTYLNSI